MKSKQFNTLLFSSVLFWTSAAVKGLFFKKQIDLLIAKFCFDWIMFFTTIFFDANFCVFVKTKIILIDGNFSITFLSMACYVKCYDDQFQPFSAVYFIQQPAMIARTNIILPIQVLRSNLGQAVPSLSQMESNYHKSKNCLIVCCLLLHYSHLVTVTKP